MILSELKHGLIQRFSACFMLLMFASSSSSSEGTAGLNIYA